MGTSKDTRRLGYRHLIYNIENGKFFYELPGDQYQELTNIDELPPLGNDWQNIGPDIYYPGNVFIGGLPPNSNIILRSNGDAEFKGDVTLNCVTFGDGSTQCSAFNGDYGVISINNNKGNVILTTGDLPNTAGFITLSDIPEGSASVTSVNGQIGTVVLDIPENTSDLNNDSGFITLADVPSGGGGAVNSVNGQTGDVVIDTFSGDYTDLTNKPAIPTNNNQLVNGAGYITSAQAPVQPGDLFSGDYDDLTNKPVIPTNNNQLTNGAGYITASDIPSTSIPNLQNVTDEGSNTTNDITLGTDKITLDAGDGSATFAGSVRSQSGRSDFGRIYLPGDGTTSPLIIARDTSNNANLWSGRDVSNVETSSIEADGSASFAGTLVAGELSNTTNYFRWRESDSVTIYDTTTTAGDEIFKVISNVTSPQRNQISFKADGSAVFAGTVTAANFNIDALQVLP